MVPVEIDSSGVNAAAASPSTNAAEASAVGDAADEADLPGVILMMRLANMAAAGVLIAVSIWLMTTIPSISAFVLAFYATCGGILICCLETQLKFLRVVIAVNFGFLFHSVWRFFFYFLLASVAWSYDHLFGKIAAGGMGAAAVFNTYVLCRYPSYRKMRDKIAEEEDKRIEARISKEVRRQAASHLTK
jgi:hypothetical protein